VLVIFLAAPPASASSEVPFSSDVPLIPIVIFGVAVISLAAYALLNGMDEDTEDSDTSLSSGVALGRLEASRQQPAAGTARSRSLPVPPLQQSAAAVTIAIASSPGSILTARSPEQFFTDWFRTYQPAGGKRQ
jgi:hypothetical protein